MRTVAKIIALVIVLGMSASVAVLLYFGSTLPPIPAKLDQTLNLSTKLYDRTGSVLLYEVGNHQDIVPFDAIAPVMRDAVIASEDAGFYQHHGVSIRGILRAVFRNIESKNLVSGGSTITQQLARSLFLTRERTLSRKIREIILALVLEQRFSKNDILATYLNTAYFGEGNYGIEAASKYYFNVAAKDLTLTQAATLTSIIPAPSLYSPVADASGAFMRRNDVLKRMLAANAISQDAYSTAAREPLNLNINPYRVLAPHFSMEVMRALQDMYPNMNFDKSGLKVTTTLDYSLQQKAEEYVYEGALRNERLYNGSNSAFVALDAKTGEVLGLVGSRDFFDQKIDGQVDVVMQKRQPGSSFKPIYYSLLFEKGYPDTTMVFDAPTNFGTTNEPYTPQNFSQKFQGPITVRQSLAQSINVTSVKVAYLVGVDTILNRAPDFGLSTVTKESQAGLSIGLGVVEVKPIELARAYATFAQDGKRPVAYSLIGAVYDNTGKQIYQYKPEQQQVISTSSARMIDGILTDDAARAPLFGVQGPLYIPGQYVAAKTGTSQEFRDAWAVGFTKDTVMVVWSGNNNGDPMITGTAGILASVPIWHNIMTAYLQDKQTAPFDPPEAAATMTKPMLNGQYLYMSNGKPEIHSILFYVNKDDPFGPMPKDPTSDPQFLRWEVPVIQWVAEHPAILTQP